jgi:hypothetical protein
VGKEKQKIVIDLTHDFLKPFNEYELEKSRELEDNIALVKPLGLTIVTTKLPLKADNISIFTRVVPTSALLEVKDDTQKEVFTFFKETGIEFRLENQSNAVIRKFNPVYGLPVLYIPINWI